MKSSIIFSILVMALLSTAVFAVDEKVSHEDKQGRSDLSKYAKHIAKKRVFEEEAKHQRYLAQTFIELSEGESVPEKYQKEWAAKGEEYRSKAAEKERQASEEWAAAARYEPARETLFSRGRYSFYDYLNAYNDYSGWNVYGSLYLGEEMLAKRRQDAADLFCEKTLLLGGKACWQSRLCESYYYSHRPTEGRDILVAQAGVANYVPAVTVQGERSPPMSYIEDGKSKTGWIYKITYSITNPHQTALAYRIRLAGPDKTFESPAMTLGRSTERSWSTAARLQSNPLIAESENEYSRVCIWFNPRIVTLRANLESEICAPIIQYEGAATRPYVEVSEKDVASVTGMNESLEPEPENPLKNA